MKTFIVNGYMISVDDTDFESVISKTWTVCGSDYKSVGRNIQVSGSSHLRRIEWQSLGSYILETDRLVDHIDRNPFNNTRANLRLSSSLTNSFNRAKYAGNPTSKYKGVSWNARHKRWYAFIRFRGKRTYLGNFINEEDAARAYDKAALEFFKEFAYLNNV